MTQRFSPRARRGASLSILIVLLSAAVVLATTSGPDVTIINITDVGNYTSSGAVSGYRGYAVGTNSCNIGTQPVWWCNSSTSYCTSGQHPVIAQNLYRLKAGRFEQIGMSWLKHGFLSTNSSNSTCNAARPCTGPPHGGDQLGLGCTDTYGASLNGSTPLGMRSEVNAATAAFPYPYTSVGTASGADQHVKVLDVDLDPAQNAGALYWAEAQYVTADDAAANNGLNNASYRPVSVGATNARTITVTGVTVREKTALRAWQVQDPAVRIANVDFTSAPSTVVERFEVGRRVTDLGTGLWHYEYAVRNVNSHRGARAFSVSFPAGAMITNPGARIVDHHSGEPYATGAWQIDSSAGSSVVWSTNTFAANPNANALRWGTMFSFWFDADEDAANASQHIALFRPGELKGMGVSLEAVYDSGFEVGTAPWSNMSP